MVLSYARGDERKENKIYLKKEKGKKREHYSSTLLCTFGTKVLI